MCSLSTKLDSGKKRETRLVPLIMPAIFDEVESRRATSTHCEDIQITSLAAESASKFRTQAGIAMRVARCPAPIILLVLE